MITQDIYIDKIKLAAIVVEQELNAINQFNQLISELRQGIIDRERLSRWPLYNWCWQNLGSLYDFLKNDYVKKLEKGERNKLKEIFKKYQSEKTNMTIDNLGEVKELILKVMSISKFHDVVRKGSMSQGLDKISDRYKLGKENYEQENI